MRLSSVISTQKAKDIFQKMNKYCHYTNLYELKQYLEGREFLFLSLQK